MMKWFLFHVLGELVIIYNNLLSGDGSESSQYYGNHKNLSGYNWWWRTGRELPHVIATRMR